MTRRARWRLAAVVLTCVGMSSCVTNTPKAPVMLGGVDLSRPVSDLYNKPFWTIELDGREIVFTGVDIRRTIAPQPRPVMSTEQAVYDTVTAAGEALRVTLRAVDGCSDSMSEESYPLAVVVELGDQVFTGCAAGTLDQIIVA